MTRGGPAGPRRIILTGFMGAGKTTVGRLLATHLGWPFVDIDESIASGQNLPVAEIFARHGEAHFRALELAAIQTALLRQPAIVALGGGALETPAVRTLLFPAHDAPAVTIYLAAPLPALLDRCREADAPVRPLLATDNVADRYSRRLPFYEQAHLILDTARLTPLQVVERILASVCAAPAAALPSLPTPAQ